MIRDETQKKTIFADSKSILKSTIIMLGLSLNQATAFLAAFLWKVELPYYLVLAFIFALVSSIYIKNITKSVFFIIGSVFIGAIIALGIVLIPPVVFGSSEMIEFTFIVYSTFTAKLGVFGLIVSIFSSIFGSLVSGGV